MKAPSKELQTMVNESNVEMEKNLLEWGKLLEKLKIFDCGFTISKNISDELEKFDEDDEGGGELLNVCVYGTPEDFLCGGVGHHIVSAQFYAGNMAYIDGHFMGESICFWGTWEYVTRKLFEMEKQILAKVPELPEDLK